MADPMVMCWQCGFQHVAGQHPINHAASVPSAPPTLLSDDEIGDLLDDYGRDERSYAVEDNTEYGRSQTIVDRRDRDRQESRSAVLAAVAALRAELAAQAKRILLLEEYAHATEHWNIEPHDQKERFAWITYRVFAPAEERESMAAPSAGYPSRAARSSATGESE